MGARQKSHDFRYMLGRRSTARAPTLVQNAETLEKEIGLLLFRVKTGQPKSEGLLKILETPENAQLMNRAELELHKDQKKVELYREKEELLFAIDEKGHEADLTEKGRKQLFILRVYPNGPAYGKLVPGDWIASIDGQPVDPAAPGAAVARLQGEVGTKVELEVMAPMAENFGN